MRKRNLVLIILSVIAALFLITLLFIFIHNGSLNRAENQGNSGQDARAEYYCPMHPNFTSDRPGSCSICGMALVKKEVERRSTQSAGKKKLLYYRNPMDPKVTSPAPMKDSMGMDYVPVYEEDNGGQLAGLPGRQAGIHISQEKQQLIGVKKEKVEKRKLIHEILTVGKVAYDPDLYLAQVEYLQALKTVQTTKNSLLSSVTAQSNSLAQAGQKRLLFLGMTGEQIEELAQQGAPQENLYLPIDSDTAWVYITVYEYEMDLVKAGSAVEVSAVAFPGETFQGKIKAITPVLNAETRAVQVRVEVLDPEHKFKPQMFVNAKIKVDLGEKLAVPESAVLDTGVRKIVYLAQDGDIIEQREVILGQKAAGYFEVLKGLDEGNIVIISGNFLIDSESKLKGSF
jgi:membrane fusion protein, copper/silver efflux system